MKNKIITYLINQLEEKPKPVVIEGVSKRIKPPKGAIRVYVLGEFAGYSC